MDYLYYYRCGECSYINENYSDALEHFKKAYSYNPSNTVLNYIGCCYIGLNQLERAKRIFLTLIGTTHWETPWYNLGRVYLKLNDRKKSHKCFCEAFMINPDNDDCSFYLGVYFEKNGDYVKAIEHYKNAYNISQDLHDKVMYCNNISYCFEMLEDAIHAKEYCDCAIGLSKDVERNNESNHDMHKRSCNISKEISVEEIRELYSLGEYNCVINALKENENLLQTNEEYCWYLAKSYEKIDYDKKAIEIYKKGLTLCKHEEYISDYYLNIGCRLIILSRLEEALAYFEKASLCEMNKVEANYNKAIVYMCKKRYNDALIMFKKLKDFGLVNPRLEQHINYCETKEIKEIK